MFFFIASVAIWRKKSHLDPIFHGEFWYKILSELEYSAIFVVAMHWLILIILLTPWTSSLKPGACLVQSQVTWLCYAQVSILRSCPHHIYVTDLYTQRSTFKLSSNEGLVDLSSSYDYLTIVWCNGATLAPQCELATIQQSLAEADYNRMILVSECCILVYFSTTPLEDSLRTKQVSSRSVLVLFQELPT